MHARLIVLLASLISIASARADLDAAKNLGAFDDQTPPLAATAEDTLRARLEKAFASARAADFSGDDRRLFAGRCFDAANPNTPINAALLVRYQDRDAGPISDTRELQLASVWKKSQPANHYDTRSYADVVAADSFAFSSTLLRADLDLLLIVGQGREDSLRRDGKYVYERLRDKNDPEAKTATYCYYFIRN